MPFTAAHALAVAPLVRWHRGLGLDPTCLVIGSMAPDFEYFARGELVGTLGHTLHGLWQWDLPVTLALAAVLHAVVKWPLLLIAPAAITARAVRRVGGPWRARWSVAALASCAASAVIGSASHIAWDAMTHANRWGPAQFPVLTTSVDIPGVGPMVWHRVLQHASTVVGLAVLAVLVVRWLRRSPPAVLPEIARGAARGLVAVCVAVAVGLVLARLADRHAIDLGNVITGAISGTLAGVIVASVILGPRARRLARAVTSASA